MNITDPTEPTGALDLPAHAQSASGRTTFRTRLRRLAASAAHGLVQGTSTALGGALVAGIVWWIQHQ